MVSEVKRKPGRDVVPDWASEIEIIFFDLDGTLYDHYAAERQALGQLGKKRNWPEQEFYTVFKIENEEAWRAAEKGNPDILELRRRRFSRTFDRLGIAYTIADVDATSDEYLSIYANIAAPLSGINVVNLLAQRGFKLGMLTNGFTPTQLQKLKMIGLEGVFNPFVAGDSVGVMKPDLKIFRHAEAMANVPAHRIALVGDHPSADIAGSQAAGWRAIHLAVAGTIDSGADLTIAHLDELLDFFTAPVFS